MSSSPTSPSTVSSSNAGDREIDYIDLVPSPSFEPEPETSFTGEKRRVVQISSDEEPDTRAKDSHVEEYAPSEHNASSSDTEFDETIKQGAARSKTAHTRSKVHKTRSTRSNSTRLKKRQKVETKIVVSASKLRQPQDPFQRVQPKLAPGCKNAFDLLGRKKNHVFLILILSIALTSCCQSDQRMRLLSSQARLRARWTSRRSPRRQPNKQVCAAMRGNGFPQRMSAASAMAPV